MAMQAVGIFLVCTSPSPRECDDSPVWDLDISHRLPNLRLLFYRLGFNIAILEYRGYVSQVQQNI